MKSIVSLWIFEACLAFLAAGHMDSDCFAPSVAQLFAHVSAEALPSGAKELVRSGDIITSTVRPNRRLSAIITPEQDSNVCSSGFVVLNPQTIAPEVLLTYLRMPIICELMVLHTSASLYPAISERDLLKLPIPAIAPETATSITEKIRTAHTARTEAHALLEKAKRAVEVAIEEGENKALSFLNNPFPP